MHALEQQQAAAALQQHAATFSKPPLMWSVLYVVCTKLLSGATEGQLTVFSHWCHTFDFSLILHDQRDLALTGTKIKGKHHFDVACNHAPCALVPMAESGAGAGVISCCRLCDLLSSGGWGLAGRVGGQAEGHLAILSQEL